MVVGLLCVGFALAAVAIVDAADVERARALVESDIVETVDKLSGAPALRREKALAIVLARSLRDDDRLYRLSDGGRRVVGLPDTVRFVPRDGRWLSSDDPPAVARIVRLAPGVELLVGRRLEQGATIRRVLVLATALIAGALGLAVAMGLWAGRALTARVEAINRACDQVRLGDLAVRAPGADGQDEFATLAAHVNAMLERIDALVAGLRDTSNRIAHELRTPVARLKCDIEEAAAAPDLKRAHALAGAAAAETDAILQTFEALLDIAEVEAGAAGGLAPMRLDEAVGSAVDLYESVAEEQGVRLESRLSPIWIIGERTLLVRMAANLIDNAIKFSPPGARVAVTVRETGAEALLCVEDQGPGIPVGERDLVLGRFQRGSAADGIKGYGLGLALVAAVAKRHGAPVTLGDAGPGLIVRLRFERFAMPAQQAAE